MAAPLGTESDIPCRSDWMAELPKKVHNTPLNMLSIPGSHNSCSYCLDWESPPSAACPELITNLCLLFGPAARQIMHNWSKCQSLTFTQQLDTGIRYLDLRVTSKPDSTDLFFEHTLYGEKIQPGLLQINAFLEKHPKEFVLLDFNHFTNLSQSSHQSLISLIKDTFGSKLCAISDVSTLTLAQVWEFKLQVIVFYHNEVAYENPEVWPGELIPTSWARTMDVEGLLSFIAKNATGDLPAETFHVTQGILTPDQQQIMGNLSSSLKDAIAIKVAPAVTEFINRTKDTKGRINICIIDFVELGGFIDSVIDLNHKD